MSERPADRTGPVDDLEIEGLSEEALEGVGGGASGLVSSVPECCSCQMCSNGET
ncbi:MAG TPA: hypothetical protein VHG91_06155 [Longimicrobium sp.]|nr:hypothetical protein [Longimicrobium sp.]